MSPSSANHKTDAAADDLPTGAFGDIDIPRRNHSCKDLDSGDRVLEGIFVGLAFDDKEDNVLEWGVHVTDPYGLVTSGTERYDLENYKSEEERKQHAADALIKMSTKWSETRGYKILGIALGIPPEKWDRYVEKYGDDDNPAFIAAVKYWASDLDATPFVVKLDHDGNLRDAASTANKICCEFFAANAVPGNIPKVTTDAKTGEVQIDSSGKCRIANLPDYQRITHKEYWRAITAAADKVKERKLRIMFLSASPQGGGVALMRHSALRLLHLLGVDAHWYVPQPRPAAFDITKRKFHNQLQGVTPDDEKTRLTDDDKKLWEDWNEENFKNLWSAKDGPVAEADLIIIDDPQLAACIPKMKKLNPKARYIYRSHIEINNELVKKENSNASLCWEYLYSFIKHTDLFISHPLCKFIPPGLSKGNVLLIPASTDPLDGLNKRLSRKTLTYYKAIFNRICVDQGSPRLEDGRSYFIQIARFDPSKGVPDCIKAYKKFRDGLPSSNPSPPQLVICGHSSVDDPDGSLVFQDAIKLLESEEIGIVGQDVCLVRLTASDQLLNALLTSSLAALQLSHREGFEVKVTEAQAKGKVVIAYDAGGLPLQIEHEKTGFVVPVGDIEQVADIMTKLATDEKLRKSMEEEILSIEQQVKRQEYYTPVAIMHYLWLADKMCWKNEKEWKGLNNAQRELTEEGVVFGNGNEEEQHLKASRSKNLWCQEYKVDLSK